MNERALSRKELDQTFNMFKSVKNINYISFLGNVASSSVSKRGVNPSFEYIDVNKPGRSGYQTMRMMIEIPSPFRKGAQNKAYKTRIPIFTTDLAAEETKDIYNSGNFFEYVVGVGRLQNYKVVSDIKYNPDFMHLLYTRIVDGLGLPKEMVGEVARSIGMLNGYYEKNYIPLTTIWSNSFQDASSYVSKLEEAGELIQYNEVFLQGLVYMPPSIRVMDKKDYILHFKVRIKRTNSPANQNVPLLFRADYDYINVIAFGEKALEWFDKLKQGHPVRVRGRLESSKYRKAKKLSDREKIIVAEKLGIKKNDEIIRDITDFFINNSVPIEFPTFNVWADEIETGLEEIMCDPVPENVQKFLDSTSE